RRCAAGGSRRRSSCARALPRASPSRLWQSCCASWTTIARTGDLPRHVSGAGASVGRGPVAATVALGRDAREQSALGIRDVEPASRAPLGDVPVRTLDALHLASIEFLREQRQDVTLASYDVRMLGAARKLGIAILGM